MDIVIPAMITLGTIMVLGFIGNYIFNRTQIPSIVWLLLLGLLIGSVFNVQTVISEYQLCQISSFFGAIAIVIILFDGGINIDLRQLFTGAPRGLLLTVSSFCLSLIATMTIVMFLTLTGILAIGLKEGAIIGFCLGAIVGGTSSIIVVPLACKLKNLQEKTKMILSIESILTDPLSIVVFLAAFVMITTNNINFLDGIKNLVSTFSIGIVAGIGFGFIWLFIMHRLRKEQFSYVLTLAIVFLVYALTESWGQGSGAIACLMFGLILGNGKKILKMINYAGQKFEMDNETKQFHSLTSFVIRTFFFVYLGMVVSFRNTSFITIGILVLIFIMILRYLAVEIATFRGGFEKDDKQTMTVMMPRGLAAAILALNYGPQLLETDLLKLNNTIPGFFGDVAFVIILGTAIICTVVAAIISRYEMKKERSNITEKQ